jgi:hypothetical protein
MAAFVSFKSRVEQTSRLLMLAKEETTRQRLMAPRDKGPMRY